MDLENKKLKEMAAEKDKILKYLRNQLDLKLDELKAYDEPITADNIKDIKKLEEMILRRSIQEMRSHIKVIEML